MGDSYDQKDAAGFIRILGLPSRSRARARRGGYAMKMWSGRFRQPLDPDFERWQRSFDFDRRSAELRTGGQRRTRARVEKCRGSVGGRTDQHSAGAGADWGEGCGFDRTSVEDDEAEDVHHFVEKQLVALIGEVGYKLHSGRSRNEQIATDLRLYVRAAIDQLRKELAEVCGAFADRAEQAGRRGDAGLYAFAAVPNRCWWRIGCWLMSKCFCAMQTGWRIAASG